MSSRAPTPGGIVERAVVDRIAVDRRADAEPVEMGGEHDMLGGEAPVAARQAGDDVARRDRPAFARDRRGQPRPQREAGHGPRGVGQRRERRRSCAPIRRTAARPPHG